MVRKKQKIVILGAGFAGIRCARDLAKILPKGGANITLVDQSNVHVFYADLYEVATAFNKKIHGKCMSRLKETIATPIDWIIDRGKVGFVHDQVVKIDADKREVKLRKGVLSYDYLVVALGSVSNSFGIPGLDQFAFSLKQLDDAVRLNCYIDQYFEKCWREGREKDVYITVGGGGATGVEMAAELVGSLKILSRKYRFPRGKIHVQIVDSATVLAGLDREGSGLIIRRLKKLGVKVYLKRMVQKVARDRVFLKMGDGSVEELPSDITIWTAGVKVNPVVAKSLGAADKREAIVVNQFLQMEGRPEIFAAGDNCFCADGNHQPCPMLAQVAYREGALIAENIVALVAGGGMREFELGRTHYLLPVGGRYAFWRWGSRTFTGFWPWFIRRLVFLRYMMSILPFWKALGKWWHSHRVFVDND